MSLVSMLEHEMTAIMLAEVPSSRSLLAVFTVCVTVQCVPARAFF